MTPLETIRLAHQASGVTVTELSELSGIARARLGEWLSRANPEAKPRVTIYKPPSAEDVRAVVEASALCVKRHSEAISGLLAGLDKPA